MMNRGGVAVLIAALTLVGAARGFLVLQQKNLVRKIQHTRQGRLQKLIDYRNTRNEIFVVDETKRDLGSLYGSAKEKYLPAVVAWVSGFFVSKSK